MGKRKKKSAPTPNGPHNDELEVLCERDSFFQKHPHLVGLFDMLYSENLSKIRKVFRNRRNINERIGFSSPLEIALVIGKMKSFHALLEFNPDPNPAFNRMESGLHIAARIGNLSAIRTLIGMGARLEAEDRHGYTPIGYAAWHNHWEVVETLVIAGAKIRPPGCVDAFQAAIENDSKKVVELFVALGEHLDRIPDSNTSLVGYACFHQKLEILDLLLETEANPNLGPNRPLTLAVEHRNLPCVERLLAAGADPDDQSLLSAVEIGSRKLVQLLLQAGADPDATRPSDFSSALMTAADRNNLPILRILLKSGADPNQARGNGSTALFFAVKQNNPRMVRSLLRSGADVHAHLDTGTTPLMIAVQNNFTEGIRVLCAGGADPHQVDSKGISALDLAKAKNLGIEVFRRY